jgi:hypothetical protein
MVEVYNPDEPTNPFRVAGRGEISNSPGAFRINVYSGGGNNMSQKRNFLGGKGDILRFDGQSR